MYGARSEGKATQEILKAATAAVNLPQSEERSKELLGSQEHTPEEKDLWLSESRRSSPPAPRSVLLTLPPRSMTSHCQHTTSLLIFIAAPVTPDLVLQFNHLRGMASLRVKRCMYHCNWVRQKDRVLNCNTNDTQTRHTSNDQRRRRLRGKVLRRLETSLSTWAS